MALKYVGESPEDAALLYPSVPARDLDDREVVEMGGEGFLLGFQREGKPLFERVGGDSRRAQQRPQAVKPDDAEKDGE